MLVTERRSFPGGYLADTRNFAPGDADRQNADDACEDKPRVKSRVKTTAELTEANDVWFKD